MLKMSSLDEDDIAILKPEDIRVRLTIDQPVSLANQNVQLELKFEYINSDFGTFQFQLEGAKEIKPVSSSGWFESTRERSQYEFKLSPLARLEFSKYQKEFMVKGKPKKYWWTVYYYLSNSQLKEALIDVELKLSRKEDFFYLLKGAEIGADSP